MNQVTPRQIYARWLKALRSGKYEQSTDCLRTVDEKMVESFCCLGVLEDLAVQDGGPDWNSPNGAHGSDESPRPEVLGFMQLDDDMVYRLIEMNDDEGKTFKEIADEIEFNIMPATGV